MGYQGKQILPYTLPIDRIITAGYVPAAADDLTNVAYVQALFSGLYPKDEARARATTNINISSPPATIDTVTMISGDRVLLADQAVPSENGVYDWFVGGMVRASDFNGIGPNGIVKNGTFIFVETGAVWGKFAFFISGTPAVAPNINVGVDPIIFSTLQANSGASLIASNGLTLLGNSLKIGGPLTENTSINGGGLYDLSFLNITSFEAQTIAHKLVVNKGGSILRLENVAETEVYFDIKANWRINIPMEAGGGQGQVNANFSVNLAANGIINASHVVNAAKDTSFAAGSLYGFAAGLKHIIGDGVSSASGEGSAAFGIDTINYGQGAITSGVGSQINYVISQRGGIAHGMSVGAGLKPVGVPYVLANSGAVNISRNTVAQTIGFGALAQDSAILGGVDNHIPSDSPGSVILGGSLIVARSLDPNQVYIPNLNIISAPPSGSTEDVLVRDAVTGQIKSIAQSSLVPGGLTGENGITAALGFIKLGGIFTEPLTVIGDLDTQGLLFDVIGSTIGASASALFSGDISGTLTYSAAIVKPDVAELYAKNSVGSVATSRFVAESVTASASALMYTENSGSIASITVQVSGGVPHINIENDYSRIEMSTDLTITSKIGADALYLHSYGGNGIGIIDFVGGGVLISSLGSAVNLQGVTALNVPKTSLSISATAAVFTDSRDTQAGIEYGDNYALDFSPRSLVDKDYVDNLLSTVLGAPTPVDKNLNPIVTTGDEASTAITISITPRGLLFLTVNGEIKSIGSGAKTRDCYFSSDGGVTAKTYSAIIIGDTLYWNGVINGYDLAITDIIDIYYIL